MHPERTPERDDERRALRRVYQKLGARSRTQAVEQARAFGLLAPPPRGRMAGGGSL